MTVVTYMPDARPTSPRRRKYATGPIWNALRHAARIARQHGPCTRSLTADQVADEIVDGITRLSDRDLHVLREVYRVVAPVA
jgi:hypothetical protein